MNISALEKGSFGGSLLRRNTGLKSTKEKQERQQKMKSQVDFYENQKSNLGKIKCDTPEEISRKLDLLHTYENEIAAAKAAYNQEQMFHTLDEARERGEQIARAAERMEHKTPEERRKEAAEEAAGEDGSGLLEEFLEELPEELLEEELIEERLPAEAPGEELSEERLPEELSEERLSAEISEERLAQQASADDNRQPYESYRPFDVRG